MGDYKICNKCCLRLSVTKFRIRKDGSCTYINNNCRKCDATIQLERSKTPEYKTYKKQYRAKNKHDIRHHVGERISAWRAKTPSSDLTSDYLVELYHKQNGLCYYSSEKMLINPGHVHKLTLSLDRLTPDKGYMQGNVVWCTYLLNTMKQDLDECSFITLLKSIVQGK